MTIKERILSYLKENSILREDFYKETGLSASNFKGAALNSELGGEKIVKILTTYKAISPDWLLTGEGSMLRNDQAQPTLPPVAQADSPGEAAAYYKMYKEEKEENKALTKENGRLEERIHTLESKLQEYEPSGKGLRDNPKGLDHAKTVSTEKPSSLNVDNATSVTAP